ncbi:L,D-transpeptidase family protein [Flavisolibacter ginsenosidimutans]|uniref:L,D-transpeptidase family protein n=1 Tax=Flavisolibacter ginsenosidimutans TaxID=661481 RepID=A0A5B8UI99_9BACT|nr:L,D-transpeptidase family protein [Flavisolibacter ginsenosidimutans]QEC56384.1 L,D-transpeptidase family protein [Flavisolibacter ginsenosidimutans]
MKTILFYVAMICSLLAACQNNSSSSPKESTEQQQEEKKNISKRDYSINKNNSYSDLFLDSATMEKYIAAKKLPDSLARRLRSFYNTRNYQFAWFTSNGLTEQARAFWNLHDYVTTYDNDTSLRDKALQKKMDALTAEEKLTASASGDFVQTELTLTQHFIRYILNNYEKGYVKRKEAERFVPFKKRDPLEMADSLLNKKHKDNKYFENVNAPYAALKKELDRYYDIVKAGGWPQLPTVKALKKGSHSPEVALLKKRLRISGEMPGSDTSQVFNDTLENAVRVFQKRLGYTPTGTVNAQLIKDLNVPAQKRLEQILVNMDRMRWMPTEPSGQLIVVNIPEFVLHVYENKKKAFDMNVVVGKEGHNTVSFSGDLSTIVFSPYWNVPPSIVKKEILPKMASNPNYLESQNMEQTGMEDGLPKIRQLPGDKNSLGHVKFLFPNSFNIYFHDTPAKSLFNQDKRAYSHGCIRLAEPEKMAEYLLRDNPEWTPDKIMTAMNQDHEQYVKLKKPVPVLITYYTAWIDDDGLLNFRDDIYSHDADLMGKMFL